MTPAERQQMCRDPGTTGFICQLPSSAVIWAFVTWKELLSLNITTWELSPEEQKLQLNYRFNIITLFPRKTDNEREMTDVKGTRE